MNLINWINGVTKLSKATMDAFQDNIKDAVDGLQDDADGLQDDVDGLQDDIIALQNKTQNFQTYYNSWGASITFYVPLGRHAIVLVSASAMYQIWNPNDQVNAQAIYGSGVSFTRDSTDTTKITGTRSGNATWTVVVF